MDDDPEEYVQMKYSRDDEVPKGWAIRDLARPVATQLGFYPASEFGVLTKLIQQVLQHMLGCGVGLLSSFLRIGRRMSTAKMCSVGHENLTRLLLHLGRL